MPGFGRGGGDRPKPHARGDRRADEAARRVCRRHGREGSADRLSELQPHDRGNRPRCACARAVRPRLARRSTRTTPRPSPMRAVVAAPPLLRREPLHPAGLPSLPRGRGDGRRLGRRDRTGFAQSLEDRGPGRDDEARLRAAQLLQPPRDLHRRGVCAAIPNVRLLEVDVDDVPWREESTTTLPEIRDGELVVPSGPWDGAATSTRTC